MGGGVSTVVGAVVVAGSVTGVAVVGIVVVVVVDVVDVVGEVLVGVSSIGAIVGGSAARAPTVTRTRMTPTTAAAAKTEAVANERDMAERAISVEGGRADRKRHENPMRTYS